MPGEGPDGSDAVGGSDERFPHEHGLVTDRREASDVVFAPDARLGHRHHLGGDRLHETGGSIGVDREGREVALVHPDELRPGVEGPRQLGLVVHLDHGVERELPGHAQEARQFRVRQRGDDQQDGIGSHEAGVADVGGAHVKSLRRTGSRHAGTDRHQVGGGTREERLVGEHRDAGGPPGLVVDRHRGGVEADVEVPLRRRAPLHFGDHRQLTPGRHRQAQGERPRGHTGLGPGEEVVEVAPIGGRPGRCVARIPVR